MIARRIGGQWGEHRRVKNRVDGNKKGGNMLERVGSRTQRDRCGQKGVGVSDSAFCTQTIVLFVGA